MNCAYLKVLGPQGTTSFTGPKMYVANTGQCTTSEGTELVFPNPGKGISYGGDYTGMTKVPATGDCVLGNSGDITVFAVGNPGNNPGTSATGTSRGTSTSRTSTIRTSATGPSGTKTSTSSSMRPTSTGSNGNTCRQGSILCSSDENNWSICVNNAYIALGKVSSGTKCVNGAIICANSNNTPSNSPSTSAPYPSQTSFPLFPEFTIPPLYPPDLQVFQANN